MTPVPVVCVMIVSGVNVALLYPVPVNLKAYAALALSNESNEEDPKACGFSIIPILDISLPVIKSGFSESFSIRE